MKQHATFLPGTMHVLLSKAAKAINISPFVSSHADDVKYDLHVLMVEHGKMCASCNKGRRGSSQCPLTPFRNKRKTSESKERTVVKEGLKKLKVEDCGEHSLHGARGALGRAVKEEVKEEDAVLRTLGTVPRTVVNKLVAIKKEEHQ